MDRYKFRFLFLFCLLAVGFQAQSMSKPPTKSISHAQAIGVRTFKYEDVQRSRPVLVELWYPLKEEVKADATGEDVYIHPREARGAYLSDAMKQYPLVIMSHGHRGDRRDRSWLAEKLVKANFLVASVEHYGNSRHTFNPILTLKYWERAKDVSFALSELLHEPFLEGRLDAARIGFAGYSLGGMTGLALAGCTIQTFDEVIEKNKHLLAEFPSDALAQFNQSEGTKNYGDTRIKAALLIAPANFLYKPDSLKQIHIPIGLVSAINDEVLPHQDHSYPIIQHVVPVKLKVLRKEISHYAFLNPLSEVGKKLLPEKYHSDPPCCSRIAIHKEVGDFAVEFFRENL